METIFSSPFILVKVILETIYVFLYICICYKIYIYRITELCHILFFSFCIIWYLIKRVALMQATLCGLIESLPDLQTIQYMYPFIYCTFVIFRSNKIWWVLNFAEFCHTGRSIYYTIEPIVKKIFTGVG